MATTTIQIRMDEEIKKQTEAALKSMGLNMSTVVNMLARQIISQGCIPFQVRTTEIPNAETRKVLDEVQQGKSLVGAFIKDTRAFNECCLVPVARRLKKR